MTTPVRILVFGATGQLGRELALAAGPGLLVTSVDRSRADLADPAGMERAAAALLAAGPYDAVVNAAAYTAVDRAETEPDRAFAVNRDGPAVLAAACGRAGVPLIHVSTDYVFDGSKPGAYVEDDPVCPLNVYGASKAAGEAAVRAALPRHLILRTSWVFAGHGRNFVATMLRLARERDSLSVVNDQTGCPTPANGLAGVIVALVLAAADGLPASAWGTYHVCGGESTTWYGFADAVFAARRRLTGLAPPTLVPVSSETFASPVRRPANSVMECGRLVRAFGIAPPDWRGALDGVVRALTDG